MTEEQQSRKRARIATYYGTYYAANRERLSAYHAAYHAANRERVAARSAAYRAENPMTPAQKTKRQNDKRTRNKLRKQARLFAGIALLTNQTQPRQLGDGTHVGLPDDCGAGGRAPLAS